ncbi:B12-binding domain-containing radical SAM protein [Mycoplasmatota bacterium]|nr:B12-binding domain-containing radical SAM protein [Mycoplasmatota bacterium]
MKTILVGINSKYIHPNLAIRYLKANTDFLVDILEFNIKDKEETMIKQILDDNPKIIGFSVYIWNVEIVKSLIKKIRNLNKDIKIILGGPEVSYVNENYFEENLCDYIIINEGEESFNKLLHALKNKEDLSSVPNLMYKKNGMLIKNQTSLIKDLNKLKDPYDTIQEKDMDHKIQYVELSRGCPYKCSYCLASLEKGLRFFSLDRVKETIHSLVKKGAKTFKFLDRSFNAKPKIAQAFLEFIIEQNYDDVVFQFEINGDVLKKEFIEFLFHKAPKNLIRFELGIQSTNDIVNQEVNRYQNTKRLIDNIKLLQKSNVTLHLDLIAGLPYEDLDSFKNTFNTIYQLFSDELQLGFLKVLKGTDIYYKTDKHQINYQDQAPYEIIDNQYITKNELNTIHKVETMLNIYWNKNFMNQSIQYLTKDIDAFSFFHNLYRYYDQLSLSTLRYAYDHLFTNLIGFLKENNMWDHTIKSYLKFDYLNHHPIKPKLYWDNSHINKNDIIRAFHKSHQDIHIDDLYKYAVVTDYLDGYLIMMYQHKNKRYYIFNKD